MKPEWFGAGPANAQDTLNQLLDAQTEQNPRVCANCLREGVETVAWVGEGGALGCVHGLSARWCLLCAAQAQLAHAEARAAEIPALQAEVARLTAERDQHLCI